MRTRAAIVAGSVARAGAQTAPVQGQAASSAHPSGAPSSNQESRYDPLYSSSDVPKYTYSPDQVRIYISPVG